MLEMMFFYDGKLSDVIGEGMEEETVIDAGDGYTANMKLLSKILGDQLQHKVITNQIALLNNKWLWDFEHKKPKLCFKDQNGVWKPVGRFTKKDLKYSHGLMKMFMTGEFADKAYRRAAVKQPKEMLRFRIKE